MAYIVEKGGTNEALDWGCLLPLHFQSSWIEGSDDVFDYYVTFYIFLFANIAVSVEITPIKKKLRPTGNGSLLFRGLIAAT